jgi:hypothetical protein
MAGKCAYVIGGANPNPADAAFPIITVEPPEVHAELDPATRRVVAAREAWTDRQLDDTIRNFPDPLPPGLHGHPRPGRHGWREGHHLDRTAATLHTNYAPSMPRRISASTLIASPIPLTFPLSIG